MVSTYDTKNYFKLLHIYIPEFIDYPTRFIRAFRLLENAVLQIL